MPSWRPHPISAKPSASAEKGPAANRYKPAGAFHSPTERKTPICRDVCFLTHLLWRCVERCAIQEQTGAAEHLIRCRHKITFSAFSLAQKVHLWHNDNKACRTSSRSFFAILIILWGVFYANLPRDQFTDYKSPYGAKGDLLRQRAAENHCPLRPPSSAKPSSLSATRPAKAVSSSMAKPFPLARSNATCCSPGTQ